MEKHPLDVVNSWIAEKIAGMKTTSDSFGFTTALIMGAARLYYGTVTTLKLTKEEKIYSLRQFKKTAGETINVMVDEYIGELQFEDSGDEGGQNVSM